MRVSIEMINGLRHKLRMMGVLLVEECAVFCDNSAVVTNARPESTYNKKHAAINCCKSPWSCCCGDNKGCKVEYANKFGRHYKNVDTGAKMKELLKNIFWLSLRVANGIAVWIVPGCADELTVIYVDQRQAQIRGLYLDDSNVMKIWEIWLWLKKFQI